MEYVNSGNIVYARVSEYVVRCVLDRYVCASLANDDTQFAFKGNLSGVRGWSVDWLARTNNAACRLDKEKRILRNGFVDLLCQRMKIIPQSYDLARRGRTHKRDRGERVGFAAR
jgi:hypothetical protein